MRTALLLIGFALTIAALVWPRGYHNQTLPIITLVGPNMLQVQEVFFMVPTIPNEMRDVFLSKDEIKTVAWLNNTTRSARLQRRGNGFTDSEGRAYVGTVRTSSNGFVANSPQHRFIWNVNESRIPSSGWRY